MRARRWEAELSAAAETDLRQIVRWTRTRFGEAQARRYARILQEALNALEHGPETAGARAREDIGQGYRSLDVARRGWRARHIILFRILDDADGARIYIVRVLHDAMDIVRHLPPEEP